MSNRKLAGYYRSCAFIIFAVATVACGGGGSGGDTGNTPEPSTLQFSSTTQSATEGTDSAVTFTVTRTGGSSGAVSADYETSDNSATDPSDYTATSGTLNWADGDADSKTFAITISNDNTAEPAESFSVSLTSVSGATLGANSSATITITDDDPSLIQGKFIDAIEGLRYVSGAQSGLTDANGGFSCESGATISFYVGDILIGTTACSALISPVDMVAAAADETHPTVSNIFAFLQTIDDDNDPSNGITITQAVRDAAASQGVNFDQLTTDFATDLNVLNVVAALTAATSFGVHDLVGAIDAQSDLNSIILNALAGIYNGTYSCDSSCSASGTWSMDIGSDGSITGSVCNLDTQISFPISGNITSSGISTIDATGSGGNGIFSGTVTLDGTFDGTWSQPPTGGPLIGNRQGVSVGGTCVLPGGNVDITGADTGTIGFSFIPVYDGLSVITNTQISILAFDINPFVSPNLDTRALEIYFDTAGTPLGIGFSLYQAGVAPGNIWGEYLLICSQSDCSGASIDTSTQTITLNNVVLFPTNLGNNNATDTLSLDGSFTYTVSTP